MCPGGFLADITKSCDKSVCGKDVIILSLRSSNIKLQRVALEQGTCAFLIPAVQLLPPATSLRFCGPGFPTFNKCFKGHRENQTTSFLSKKKGKEKGEDFQWHSEPAPQLKKGCRWLEMFHVAEAGAQS